MNIPITEEKKRHRILFVIWSLDQGGAEQVVINLAKQISLANFEPLVCCLNEKGRYAPSLEALGIPVIALHKKRKIDLLLLFRLVRLIREKDIDLIHTHLFTSNLWGRVAAWLTGVPVIHTEHNVDSWKKGLHFVLDSCLMNISKRSIFVSKKVRSFYEKNLISLNGKSRIFYNGIDTKLFSAGSTRNETRQKLGISSSSIVIGTIGRLVPQKAQDDFIRAIGILRSRGQHVIGLIVGEGEMEKPLREQARLAGIEKEIIFTGFSTDVPTLYQAMDIFALTSFREGFPMTILEAMASGVPVIATDVGGVSECISHQENGILIRAGHPEQLAEAALSLLTNTELRNSIVRNALGRVRHDFSIETMSRNHESLYCEVLGVNNPPPEVAHVK